MNRLIVAFVAATAVVGAFSAPAAIGEEYWIAWEGDDFPENQGWTREYGNWDGPGQGQANRTLYDGILTIDSLHDQGVYDFYEIVQPGQIDPGPGEMFVMEWSLRVEEVDPSTPIYPYDPGVDMRSDGNYELGLAFETDGFYSEFEYIEFDLDMSVWHEFRVVSFDMRNYTLYVDDTLVYTGSLEDGFFNSSAAWGDGTQGNASLHHWDYFRFGVVPEPGCLSSELASDPVVSEYKLERPPSLFPDLLSEEKPDGYDNDKTRRRQAAGSR